jgi:hypothetical protein
LTLSPGDEIVQDVSPDIDEIMAAKSIAASVAIRVIFSPL